LEGNENDDKLQFIRSSCRLDLNNLSGADENNENMVVIYIDLDISASPCAENMRRPPAKILIVSMHSRHWEPFMQ
jgi:hypothetical protein